MKKMHSIYAALFGLLVLVGSTSVQAVPVTIDFEAFTPLQNLNGDTEDGFTLTDLGFNLGVITPPGFGTGTPNSKGFGPNSSNSDPLLEIVRNDGGLFELLAFESMFTLPPAVSTLVTGYLGGAIVGQDVFAPFGPVPPGTGAVVPAHIPVSLAGIIVDRIEFDLGIGGFEAPQSIDNIVLNTVAAVPLPSTLLLFGVALLGFARVRRTR